MDIADTVTDHYVLCDPDDRVSSLVGTFDDPDVRGVLVQGDSFEGVVTRRQLATSHHPPDEKLGSLVWHVPRLAPDEDVRKVAQLMVDADAQLLPVFEGGELVGAVTADDVLATVEPYLDAATVEDAATEDLVTIDPSTTVGRALHDFREHHVTHLPVVEDDSAVGILSLYDVTDLTVRAMETSQGGDASGTDSFGGDLGDTGRAHGGHGAREGELDRILDVPVRDAMSSPVHTVAPSATLDEAVRRMRDVGGSSLVVTRGDSPHGIVTTTDVLDALTWGAEGDRAVQIYGTELLDTVSYDEVLEMIDGLDGKDDGMSVIDARIHLQEHDEQLRGTPLVLARMRLHTDDGLFVASGEGYGAGPALNEARDAIERQIRDAKTRGMSKKHPGEEHWEQRFAWMLEGAE